MNQTAVGEFPLIPPPSAPVRPFSRRPRALVIVAWLGALLVIALGSVIAYRARHPIGAHFRTAHVVKSDITERVTATGTLQPVITSPVGAQVSGIVWRLHADYNSVVSAGQVLVELDPALFRNAVALASAQLTQARANLVSAQATERGAEIAHARTQSLEREALATQADLDASIAALGQARGLLRSSQAQIAEARAQLDRAQLDLEHSVIRSPVDGTVISRNIDVGQAVASTLTAPTLFTIAQDLSHMQVHAAVDEADIGEVRTGQSATFTVDAFRARSFPAVVREVRNAPQTTQNVVTYDVVLDVDNGSGELRPGMTANVAILIVQRHEVAAVPNEALRFRPPSAVLRPPVATGELTAPGAAVYLAQQGQAVRTPIEIGISDGNLTEVRGLEPGREVIIDMAGPKGPPSAGGFRRDL